MPDPTQPDQSNKSIGQWPMPKSVLPHMFEVYGVLMPTSIYCKQFADGHMSAGPPMMRLSKLDWKRGF